MASIFQILRVIKVQALYKVKQFSRVYFNYDFFTENAQEIFRGLPRIALLYMSQQND